MKTFNSKTSKTKTSDIDSAGALDIDAGSGNVSIDSSSGSVGMGESMADGQTVKIGPSGKAQIVLAPHGTAGSEKISLTNTGGDATDAIGITSTAGGITFTSAAGKMKLTLASIPNSDSGLSAGQLYRDGTNLLIAN